MFFVYVLAVIGLVVMLVGAAIGLFAAWQEEPTDVGPDPYQAAIDAAGRIQEQAWVAIQKLHELRVDGRADVIDGSAAEDTAPIS